MKICVTSEGGNLDSKVDPRFGRCKYFLFVDTETLEFEIKDNISANASGGAGIQAGQLMATVGVKAVVTGHVGPNAFQTLQAAGIDIYIGASGTAAETIENFKNGKLKKTDAPDAAKKSGFNR